MYACICVCPPPQMDDDGEVFYSLDDGRTRFTDLIQLVEFYQLNRGVLPCKLKHHCARITLWTRDPRDPRGPNCTLTPGPFWTNTPSVPVPWRRKTYRLTKQPCQQKPLLTSTIVQHGPSLFFFLRKKPMDCIIADNMCWRWCAVLSGEQYSLAL